MKIDKVKSESGKLGAKKRWQGRTDAIEILRAKYSKKDLDIMLGWKTEPLIELAKWVSKS